MDSILPLRLRSCAFFLALGLEKMIQLLFTVLAAEAAATAALLFKTPLRNLVVLGLDRLKRGRSTVMVKTLAATAVVVLASSIYSMAEIRLRFAELGDPTPTDQILMSRHLLEASLLGMGIFFNLDASCSAIKSYYHSTHVAGYSLFLALIIDRLHLYIRELHELRNSSMEAVMKQNRVTGKPKTGSS
ncbi:hypothetical protein GW17_00025067 [Ensete ventricosum]|nr:hypothetical protein GW17_00025067 [Ensete ventricosum]